MKKYTDLLSLNLVVFLAFFFFAGTASLSAMRVKLAVIVPERSAWGKYFKQAVKEIKQKTDGKVTFRIYFGGVQGDELKVVRKMRIGQLHGAGFMARGMSKICPDSLVFSIPLLFHDEHEAVIVHNKMQDFLQAQARKRGYEVLGWSNQGFTYCFSKDRVTNISELRQAKPWMLENDDFCKSFFKCSSISAVPAQVGDVMTALQSGMIHTVFSPPIGMILMQWYTRVKYQLDLGVFYSFGAVVLTQKQWRKIPDKYKPVVKEAFVKALAEVNKAIDKQNKDALKVMSKTVTVLKPSAPALVEFRGITRKVEEDMAGKAFSYKAMNLLKKYLKEYREKNKSSK